MTLDPPVPTGPPLVVTTAAPAASAVPDWRHWYDPTEGRVRPVWGTLGSDGTARFDPMDRMNDHLTAYRR